MASDIRIMIESPCVGICRLNRANICVGCGRSRLEIGQWTLVAAERQAEIVAAARERLKHLREQTGSREVNESEPG